VYTVEIKVPLQIIQYATTICPLNVIRFAPHHTCTGFPSSTYEAPKVMKRLQSLWAVPSSGVTHLLTYGAEPFLRSCQLCSHSGTSQHFKEPEGSSPYSQEPCTGLYPEPDRSSPHHGGIRRVVSLTGQYRWPILDYLYKETSQNKDVESDKSSPGPHILFLEE
jgi:hypothetical protein